MPLFLDIASIVPPHHPVSYAVCPTCKTMFQLDFITPNYSTHPFLPAALKFYIEQGAGLETLVLPAFIAGSRNKRRYMEIGCGFGFGLDFAKRVFDLQIRGIDPSEFAKEGRRLLQIPIDNQDFDQEVARGYGEQDAIAAMEVIEHFSNPIEFLRTARASLAPDGLLIITTPDANAVTFGEEHPNLAVLTPGYHAVIFNQESLGFALRTVGFTDLQVGTHGATLFAIAGQGASEINFDSLFNQVLYQRYLENRLRFEADDMLEIGLGYRLMKLLVNVGQYAAAEEVLNRLADTIWRRDEIDVLDPHKLLAALPNSCTFQQFVSGFPACLGGILYFSGMIRLNKDGDRAKAIGCFYAAHVVIGLFRNAMFAHAIDDGETADLERRAGEHVRLVLGWMLELASKDSEPHRFG
jgi:SAM-dependent methyltransferase